MATNNQQRDDGRQSDLAVMDANEYKQKRRMKRILDVLEAVEEKADDAWDGYVLGEISHDAKNIIIQRAVKQAIYETYNHLKDREESLENHDRYWAGYERVEQTENGGQKAVADGGEVNPIGVIELSEGQDEVIWGLRDFMETQHFYEEVITEKQRRRHRRPKVVEHRQRKTVPEEVSRRAYLLLKRFLGRELHLDVEFESMEVDEHGDPW